MIRLSALRVAIAAMFMAMTTPVAAAAPPAHGGEDEVDNSEVTKSVELLGLVFPVFDEDYQLKNYLFVNARMVVADNKDTWKFREQAHFVRDAVLRQAHRSSFHKAGDFHALDIERAMKECLQAGNEAVGEDAFVSMTFTQIASQN